ncbi:MULTISPECIES: hypothetical protein [Streptomyces]|uniref:Uncharacterized protein n=1 Tax=Streptomyces lycii TaxID=2654337 RepID=A0ABQ7FNZ7_9ACTN|nr:MULTISPECIES: hypothetical protein [Streptomyces]KAF4410395.1 hypothetical protein GCU69_03965 [Streptomyces lycii]PGH47119.1 hypothetical protein CRI70_30265 [Streptomyces sp. Ru87]
MGQRRTLARGTRVLGALLCGLLALTGLGWTVRDLAAAAEPGHLWWSWAGLPVRPGGDVPVTSLTDLFLCTVQAAACVTALRSRRSAAAALAAAGAATVALRLPGLWILRRDEVPPSGAGLRDAALLTAAGGLLLGLALVLLAALGRRAVPDGPVTTGPEVYVTSGFGPFTPGGGYAPPVSFGAAVGGPAGYGDGERSRPRGTAVRAATAVLLTALAAAGAGWQVHRWREWGSDTYARQLTGGPRELHALLQPPAAWTAWTAVALALAAAVAVVARAVSARPPAGAAGALFLLLGVAAFSAQLRVRLYDRLFSLPAEQLLEVLTGLFLLFAGALVLLLTASLPREPSGAGEAAVPAPRALPPGPPPPSPRPPGW